MLQHLRAGVPGNQFFFQKELKGLPEQFDRRLTAFGICAGNGKHFSPHETHLLSGFYAQTPVNLRPGIKKDPYRGAVWAQKDA